MNAAALERYKGSYGPADHTFEQFKSNVHELLTATFGARVERRNKCIFVPETASGVDGDVVPAFVHRRFGENGEIIADGIEFYSDDGRKYDSFPEQHYENGVAKNDRTRRMYKRVVRILKNVRGALVDRGELEEKSMPSFFIECLTYNAVPDSVFLSNTYRGATEQVIKALWEATDPGRNPRLVEVNGLKWLFDQVRTPEQARAFLGAAYKFIGY
jgi:hypothetical protein